MEALVTAFVSMAILGGVLGLILAVASRRFHVETDPRVERVQDALPGANCGACGFPGCSGYAEAVVAEGADITLCAPGGQAVVDRIAGIMGVSAAAGAPELATCRCQAESVETRFEYDGVRDCKSASVMGLAGGYKACTAGCLGFGSCARACPFGAIAMSDGPDPLPVVDEARCTGCGQCVPACPRSLMRVDAVTRVIYVRCMNREKGAAANKLCAHACIACRKCEKECPVDAIHVENNLAVIDYDKCIQCGKCVKVCPKQCIVNLRPERKEAIRAAKAAEKAQAATTE